MPENEFDSGLILEELRRANKNLSRQLSYAKAKTTELVEAVTTAAYEAAPGLVLLDGE